MFNFSADKLPVSIILSLSLIDFIVFFSVKSIWFLFAYFLLMIVPRACVSAWNHHHQHRHVFKQNTFNRILEFFYALHTGVTTNLWVLHHNYGHHRHFLDQQKDESRWQRDDGATMSVLEYTITVALTAYPRGFNVGKSYPKQQKQFIFFSSLTLLFLFVITLYNPTNALFVFVLPMVASLLYTSFATYEHHSRLDTGDEFSASRNNISPFYNLMTGNLGYHTAHHYKQGVHWSKVPELHEQIKHKIPDCCYRQSRF
ncbi:MAG: fatty acid desaturase [Cocleimonas sp.]|nr:fatty acid desaturase [Cocleimonas sp.]